MAAKAFTRRRGGAEKIKSKSGDTGNTANSRTGLHGEKPKLLGLTVKIRAAVFRVTRVAAVDPAFAVDLASAVALDLLRASASPR